MYTGSTASTADLVEKLFIRPSEFTQLSNAKTPEINRSVYEYYQQNSAFGVYTFDMISSDREQLHTVRTLCGRPFEYIPEIKDTELSESFVSEYNTSILSELGLDLDESWNGDIAAIQYTDGNVIISESDYYTIQTIEKLFDLEAFYAYCLADSFDQIYESHFPIRNEILRHPHQFFTPNRPVSGSSIAGLIFNTGDTWKLLFSKRGANVSTNSNMVDIQPGGFVEYNDLWGGTFSTVPIREGIESLFHSNEQYGTQFFKQYVSTYATELVWRLKNGGLLQGNLFVVEDPEGYEYYQQYKSITPDSYGVYEVDIYDFATLKSLLTLQDMSGDSLGIACLALEKFDSLPQYPALPYTIHSRVK